MIPFSSPAKNRFEATAIVCAMVLLGASAAAQVLTIDTSGKGSAAPTSNAPVDRQYRQVDPTKVDLPKTEMSTKTRLELERVMQSEQGFAMRPLPRGRKGLTLEANGKLDPAGESYLNMAVSNGITAKPGERVVITDIKFDKNKIELAIDGGPDFKHKFLRHVQVGMGDPNYGNPVVPDEPDPTGARITLAFKEHVPDITADQVKALLAPLITFDVKTPVQAFTDTLPPQLKDAILNHEVWVGMSTDMVIFAKGQPVTKTREMDGQMPFEEWIYGKPPDPVDFVRINGNRVIRVEIAKTGEPVQVFTKDVVDGLLRTDGTPVMAANTRTIAEGDVEKDPNKEAPDAPPSLKQAGEADSKDPGMQNTGQMRPVQMPKPHTDDDSGLGQNPDDQPPATAQPATASGSSQPASSSGAGQTAPTAGGSNTAQP